MRIVGSLILATPQRENMILPRFSLSSSKRRLACISCAILLNRDGFQSSSLLHLLESSQFNFVYPLCKLNLQFSAVLRFLAPSFPHKVAIFSVLFVHQDISIIHCRYMYKLCTKATCLCKGNESIKPTASDEKAQPQIKA